MILVVRAEVKMTMSSILAPLAGSKWYFNYSYTCGNTCIGLIYASFDPSLGTYKIVPTGLTVAVCASIWLGKLPSMPSYVLRS